MKLFRIDIKGLGVGTVHAENRSQAYVKVYNKVKHVGYYTSLFEFKKDVISLKVIEE